jgi:hypothetical protein
MPLPGRPNPTDPGDAADLSTPQGYWYCNRIRRFGACTPVPTPGPKPSLMFLGLSAGLRIKEKPRPLASLGTSDTVGPSAKE